MEVQNQQTNPQATQLIEFQNQRRVVKSFKHFRCQSLNKNFVVTSSMMFASSDMDGSFNFIQAQDLASQEKPGATSMIVHAPTQPVPAVEHFIDTECGVSQTMYLNAGPNVDLLVAGLEDGSLHVYNPIGQDGFYKSFQRFSALKGAQNKTNNNTAAGATTNTGGEYERFAESMYEHSDVIVALESVTLGQKDQQMDDEMKESKILMLSASKDGFLFIWSINKDEAYKASKWCSPSASKNATEEEANFEILNFQAELHLQNEFGESLQPTAAIWLNDNTIAVSTVEGFIYFVKVGVDSQNVPYLDQAIKLVHTADCSVWDMCCVKKSQTLICACDSGKILAFNFDKWNGKAVQPTVIYDLKCESALCVSLDMVKDMRFLTIGGQSQVVVMQQAQADQQDSSFAIEVKNTFKETSDNVSAVKTFMHQESKTLVTMFATFNGRVSFFRS